MKKTIALFLSLFLILSGLNAGLAETAQTGNSNGYWKTAQPASPNARWAAI